MRKRKGPTWEELVRRGVEVAQGNHIPGSIADTVQTAPSRDRVSHVSSAIPIPSGSSTGGSLHDYGLDVMAATMLDGPITEPSVSGLGVNGINEYHAAALVESVQ